MPVLVDLTRRGNEIADGMNDNSAKPTRRNVEKDRCQRIERQENNDGSKDSGKWSPDSGLGLDSSPRERPRGWVPAEKGPKDIGEADSNELLRRVDNVVVDTSKRLGDGDVLDQKNQDGGGDFGAKGPQNLLVKARSADMLEA